MIGESPARPAIFQASPLVVVQPDISAFAFKARQLMVPVGGIQPRNALFGRGQGGESCR
jgi:hypothetical protein